MSMYGSFVIPPTLATSSDYRTWTSTTPPKNIAQVLRGCSSLVLDATMGVLYDTDPATGLATDASVATALTNATCIQAAAWVALNIDPTTGGVMQTSKTAKAKRIGTASIEYNEAEIQAAAAARQAAYTGLVPEAVRYLAQRNLLATEAWSRG